MRDAVIGWPCARLSARRATPTSRRRRQPDAVDDVPGTRFGPEAMCVGGGQGLAALFERVTA